MKRAAASSVSRVGALEVGRRGVEGCEDLQGMTERFRSPLGCWRHCLPAPPPSAHFPFPPGRRRWLKITPWRPALQRAARAAKGKDNVLAALIGVCGCHILITSFKKKRWGGRNERKKRKRLHYVIMQGMQVPLELSKLEFFFVEIFYSPSLSGTQHDAKGR